MNKVILTGNITRDPECRYSTGTNPVAYATFGIAVKRQFSKNSDVDTDFFNLIAFGQKAEFVEKYVRKGGRYNIVGRIENNTSTDSAGNKRVYTNIVVEEIEFGETKASAENRGIDTSHNAPASNSFTASMDDDDDLPF